MFKELKLNSGRTRCSGGKGPAQAQQQTATCAQRLALLQREYAD